MDNNLSYNHKVDSTEKQALAAGADKLNTTLFEMADAYARDPQKFEGSARQLINAGAEVPIRDGSGDSLYVRALFGVNDGIKRSDNPQGLDANAFKEEILKPALEKALNNPYGIADFNAVQIKFDPADGKGGAVMATPVGEVKVFRDDDKDSPMELAKSIEKNIAAIDKNQNDKDALKALHKNAERLAKNYDPVFNEQVNCGLDYLHAVKNAPEAHLLGGSTDAIWSYIHDEKGNKLAEITASANKPTQVVKAVDEPAVPDDVIPLISNDLIPVKNSDIPEFSS